MLDLNTLIGKINKFTKEICLNRNIITYLVCVVIASILWFMNTFSQEYLTELSYPIKYINTPEDKYPMDKLPEHLQLDVQAKGFTLLGYRIKTSFQPITFNFANYEHLLQEKDGISEYILNTNDIKEKLGNQINPDIKLVSIYPEKITFRFAPAQKKRVPIYPMLDYKLKRQYILNQIKLNPDSVTVSGPANIINKLQKVTTEAWTSKELSKTTKKSLKLAHIENCHLEKNTTEITLEVEQFTEARRTINILTQLVPDSINMRLFPSTLNISYEVGLSKYDQVSDNDFIFAVDYPQDREAAFLEVKVIKAPTFIKNLKYTPQKVEFLLEKK